MASHQVPQLPDMTRVPQPTQGVLLYLTDALFAQAIHVAHVAQCVTATVLQAESQS
jgi:hypothetical protein